MSTLDLVSNAQRLLPLNLARISPARMQRAVHSGFEFITFLAVRVGVFALVALASVLVAAPASAQTQTFNNTTTGALDSTTPCNAAMTRTFSVASDFLLGDVDIGMRGSHTYRGDVRAALRHPDGTTVLILDGNGSVSGDNFNFRLNDGGTQLVNTDGNTTNHLSTAVNGGYQHNFIPDNALSAFNGKSSAGTWTLLMCDSYPTEDNGIFRQATLYLTPQTAPFADLSVTKAVSTASPVFGQDITYTVTVTNASSSTATANAIIRDVLPAGVSYLSDDSGGAYDPATGDWTVTALAPNTSRTLVITVDVVAGPGSIVVNNAEVWTSSITDIDSTSGNGSTSEDDDASASFTVQGTRTAGVPPALTCPDGSIAFDWAGRTWTPGSTSNDYNLAGFGAFDWDLTSPAPYLDIAAYGGAHPRLTTAVQSTTSLSLAVDFNNRFEVATTTISLGEVVDGAQFTIFDVDFAANDFADKVTVTGKLNGADVIPILTNGLSNYVIGNTAFGDQSSSDTQTNGNVVATFTSAVDTIVIDYGNHGMAPADPDGQAIQMSGNIQVCNANTDLTVSKSSTPVSDPVSGETSDAFAIPDAVLRYCILITNTGTASARSVTANDTLPANLTYNPGTIKSGATCAAATVEEDDDAVGTDDTDFTGVSFNSGTITIAVPELPGGETVAVTYEGTIQ